MKAISKWLTEDGFAKSRELYDAQGYLVFENVLSANEVTDLKSELRPFLDADIKGRNDFEGLRTNRVYALPAKSDLYAELTIHPLVMAFAEADLGKSCRLSSCLAINLQPGESVQPWHYDDAHIDLPRPRASFGLSAFWVLDETTTENGATEILPGSHIWPEADINGGIVTNTFQNKEERAVQDDPGAREDALKITMPEGSLMITKGTLWHRGGANRSAAPRLIVTPQYCMGWARQLENMMATMPPERAAQLPPRVQELIGYSIHPPFMGYVDGVHPKRKLGVS